MIPLDEIIQKINAVSHEVGNVQAAVTVLTESDPRQELPPAPDQAAKGLPWPLRRWRRRPYPETGAAITLYPRSADDQLPGHAMPTARSLETDLR